MTISDIDILNAEAKALFDKLDLKQAAELSNKAYTLAKKQKYPKGIAEALLTRGSIFLVQQKNLQAQKIFMQAHEIIESIGDHDLQHNIYTRLGATYCQLFLIDECIDYLTKALEVSKSIKNYDVIAGDYINLAIALSKTKNFSQAMLHYDKAMTYAIKYSDEKAQAIILTNLAQLCLQKGDYELALKHGLDGLKISEKLNNTRSIINTLHNISESYMHLKRFDDAEHYNKLFLTLATENNYLPMTSTAELLRAEINLLQEKYSEAKEILLHIEKLPTFKSDVQANYKYYDLYLKIYEATGDYKNAYDKLKEFIDFDRKQAEAHYRTNKGHKIVIEKTQLLFEKK